VRVSEAPSFGVPVTLHDPYCAGTDAYVALAREVAVRGR
jgi:chromosome partitioning protein